MKRNTRVAKPNRGEQEPFSRQLHLARKESLRLRIVRSCNYQVIPLTCQCTHCN